MSEYFTLARGGRVSGGSNVTGGFVATGGYANSKLPAEKQKLIRSLASSLKDALNLKGDVSTMSSEKLIEAMEKFIPHRSRMGADSPLITSTAAQKTICKRLAIALNKHAEMSLDPDENPDALCDQVSEALHSIFTGVRGEFLIVAKDVKTSLLNLQIMKNSLKNSFDSMMIAVGKSTDSSVKTQAQSINMIYKGLIDVLNNQINVLSNTLNMRIDPVTATIADLSETDNEWRGYVRKLKKDLGVPRIGHRLAFTLAGLKHSAIMANEVNGALKQIGASVDDYTKYSDLKSLERHLTDLWEKHHNKPTMDDVANLMASLDIIRTHQYNHDDIAAELKRKGGDIIKGGFNKGGCDTCIGGESDDLLVSGGYYSVAGGSDDLLVNGGNLKKLEKRMKNQKVFRTMLLKDFRRRLEDYSQTLAVSVEHLGKQLGKSIPLDDNLEEFKNAFRVLSNDSIHRVNFYMAISGFKTDARSKDERSRFLGNLKAARRATQPLLANASSKNYFQPVAKSLDDLVSFIDGFADRYLKPMSNLLVKTPDVTNIDPHVMDDSGVSGGKKKKKKGGEDGEEEKCEKCNKDKSECECEPTDVATGGEDGGDAGTDYHFVSLQKVSRDLVFYHGVAKMRDNLKGVEAQIKSASSDYTTISGEAVGDMVTTLKKRHNAWLKDWEDKVTPNSMGKWLKEHWTDSKTGNDDQYLIYFASSDNVGGAPLGINMYLDGVAAPAIEGPKMTRWKEGVLSNIVKFKELQLTARVKLYKTAESIDLYLIQFANAVASDPGSIKGLGDITKELDAIANWYTDRSGASMSQLFESMPYNKDNHGQFVNVDVEKDFPLNGNHYYEQVRLLLNPNGTAHNKGIGNPFLSMLCGVRQTNNDLEDLLKRAKTACSQVRVIDNLIKLFAQAGNRIGDKDLDSEQYMPLEMIKQNLSNYIFMSAFSMGCQDNSTHNNSAITAAYQNGDNNNGAVAHLFAGVGGTTRADTNPAKIIGFDVSAAAVPTPVPPGGVANPLVDIKWMAQKYGIAMRPIKDNKYNSINNDFTLDDSIYVMVVKSMIAKVFTVISAYGVTNKPLFKYSSISNARQIMGGAKKKKKRGAGALDSIPEVIPDATELYIRLPLLAEFYREILKFEDLSNDPKNTASGKTKKISMVPELDDVWQDLIKIVFDEAKHVEEGTYSENQVRRIIRSVNDIYHKYKESDSNKTNMAAINGFVAEINRRYGVVEQRHIDEYINDRKNRYKPETYNEDETPEYDILDKNSAGSQSRRPLPSDRFDVVGDFTITPENKFDQTWIDMVRNFRNNIDREICKHKPSALDFSFTQTIIQQKRKVAAGKDNTQRYKDVLKAVQSSDQLNNVNHYKALMFHEAVVSPLATLYALHSLLKTFCIEAEKINIKELETVIRNNMDNIIRAATAAGAAGADVSNAVNGALLPTPSAAMLTHFKPLKTIAKGEDGADAPIPVLSAITTAGYDTASERDKELCTQFLQRYLIDRDSAFKSIVELIWGIGTDLSELVVVKIESNHIICDFSKMTEYILYTMRSTKSNLEKFRNVVSPEIIRLYEGGLSTSHNRGAGASENPASIYWLEENLIEKLINGRDQDGLDVANERIAGCYSSLKRRWDVIGRLYNAAPAAGAARPFTITGIPFDMDVSALSDKRVAVAFSDNEVWKAWETHLQCLRQHSVDAPMEHLVYWNHDGGSMRAVGNYNDNNSRESWPFAILPRSADLLEKDDAEDGARLKTLEKAFEAVLKSYPAALQAVLLLQPPNNIVFAAGSKVPAQAVTPADNAYNAAAPAVARPRNVVTDYNKLVDTYMELVNENKDLAIVRGRMSWYSDGKDHSWTKMDNVGLLVDLNQTLSYYLRSCYDPSMRKMYTPLVKHFGEGSNAYEIMNGNAIDDLTNLTAGATTIGVPPKGSTIFASLAQVIKNTLQSRKNNTNRDPRYRTDALMEVPDHIKENLREALPSYCKMFYAVRVKAEMLRKFVQNLSTLRRNIVTAANNVAAGDLLNTQYLHNNSLCIFNGPVSDPANVPLGFTAGTSAVASDPADSNKQRSPLFRWGTLRGKRSGTTGHPNVCVPYDPYIPGDCLEQREFYTGILDGIKSSAQSLEKCASNVYEELGDINPRFAELYEGYLEDYNESNKHDPVMPLSIMQMGLRNRTTDEQESTYASSGFMLPFYRSKENPHKLNYGARKVFGGLHRSTDPDPNFEQLYGPKVLLDGYNAISSSDTRLDDVQYEKGMGAHAMLIRYLLDTRNTRKCYSLSIFANVLGDAPLSNGLTGTSNANWKPEYRPYSMQNNLSRMIALVESSDADSAIREINKCIHNDIKDIDRRSQARIFNLIDMSIVPINVHAMMRDIPLVNLINYSYTFDRMIQEYLLPDQCDLVKSDVESTTSVALLNKLIQYPYCSIGDIEYDALLHRLMSGDSALGLGRPKYLSDQLYNKVLFRDIYRMPNPNGPDETGPSVDSAQFRYFRNGNQNNINRANNPVANPTLQYLDKENKPNGETWNEFQTSTWKDDGDKVRNPNRLRIPELKSVHTEIGGNATREVSNYIGKLRFDTMLVRNMMFLVNIQRVCRSMMRDELSTIENAVITGNKSTSNMDYLSSEMTDYNQNENYEDHANQFKSRRRAMPNE